LFMHRRMCALPGGVVRVVVVTVDAAIVVDFSIFFRWGDPVHGVGADSISKDSKRNSREINSGRNSLAAVLSRTWMIADELSNHNALLAGRSWLHGLFRSHQPTRQTIRRQPKPTAKIFPKFSLIATSVLRKRNCFERNREQAAWQKSLWCIGQEISMTLKKSLKS